MLREHPEEEFRKEHYLDKKGKKKRHLRRHESWDVETEHLFSPSPRGKGHISSRCERKKKERKEGQNGRSFLLREGKGETDGCTIF